MSTLVIWSHTLCDDATTRIDECIDRMTRLGRLPRAFIPTLWHSNWSRAPLQIVCRTGIQLDQQPWGCVPGQRTRGP